MFYRVLFVVVFSSLILACAQNSTSESKALTESKAAAKSSDLDTNPIAEGKKKAKKKQSEQCEQAHFRWMEARAAEDEAAIAAAKRSVDKHCAKG